MIVGNYMDKPVEPQTKFGTTGTVLRVLVGRDEGARIFTMRLITIDPGGQIGMHDHPWEHEIFVVRGEGKAMVEGLAEDLEPGKWAWIPPDETHGFENTGDEPLEFICCIPMPKS
jgi:quercetin dioxygenase-like cupin family protein